MIRFLLDSLIGPLLVLLRVIEIQENGDWVIRRRKKERYDKEERKKDGPSFVKKIKGGIESLWVRKKKGSDNGPLPEQFIPTIPLGNPASFKPASPRATGTLRRIPKMDALALAKTGGKRICYTDRLPKDWETEKDVLYIVQSGGEPITYRGPLAGIRKDGYYVYDPVKYDDDEDYDEAGWKD